MPSRGEEPAGEVGGRGALVEVERLRVELGGEGDHLGSADLPLRERQGLADGEILEIAFRHARLRPFIPARIDRPPEHSDQRLSLCNQ